MSRNGIQGFQSDRLAQILAVRKLSQAQLAALVGVSPTTISKWRGGGQVPEREALDKLASVVNVTPEWFMRSVTPKLSVPLFRSNASAHVAARSMLEGRLEWMQDLSVELEEFVDYPELNLPCRSFVDPEEITAADIESAAAECRASWRLGSGVIQDLALAIEGAGVLLVREETGIAQIEGLSAWSSVLSRPLILLSADKDNGYRSRFDLAHELGHLILHKNISRVTERDRHKQLEHQAHCFAGALLLPAESFANEIRTPVTLDDLLLIKRRWGVSVGAIIMRLFALEIINDDEKQNLFKRKSARWGAKAEPGDKDRAPEMARLLRRAIELLVDENVMPLDAIPRHIGFSTRDIETLAGLPEGYFSLNKVVQLASIKKSTSNSSLKVGEGSVLNFPSSKSN